VTAVGALVAAWAAYKSASTAQTVHSRGIFRDVLNSATTGIGEMERIDELIEQMKRGISDLQRLGGLPDKRMIARAEEKQQEMFALANEAAQLLGDPLQLRKKSADDLMQELTKMEGFLSQARQIRDSLEKQVSAIQAEIPFPRQR